MSNAILYRKRGEALTWALLRRSEDFGLEELDLLRAPARFWADGQSAPAGAELNVDVRRVEAMPFCSDFFGRTPTDNWHALSARSVARLFAWFLIVEDPQRRLEAQPVVTLAHQASVVKHIVEKPELRRALLADEVGLGKTVEAGLLIRQVLEQNRAARVLYLAPARLVRNVCSEFRRLGMNFRRWVASGDRDATLEDQLVVASIHRASHEGRVAEVVGAPRWDMIVVDECHHLSAWAPGGGNPVAQYRLVEQLAGKLADDGRLLLMSGTPHQGHADRFRNLLRLVRKEKEPESVLAGRVIYRTKEDVQDWEGRPLFPRRQVNAPLLVDLGAAYQEWLDLVLGLFEPERVQAGGNAGQRRVAGWRAGQALQWATSSTQAGLGYLIRQAIRGKLTVAKVPELERAIAAIRPYRGGASDEPVDALFERMRREVLRNIDADDVEDIEDEVDETLWRPDPQALSALLGEGVDLLTSVGDAKWERIWKELLKPAGSEKVVLFAQPIETVSVVADFLERKTGRRPAVIVGGQSEGDRETQVKNFWDPMGPQFLVSSRAGGEGINLQVARRLVHLDVPWNPMEMEQRIGRVHRFLSRKTILVDTVVVKDSREADTYAYARRKLEDIAHALVPEDRFEALFSRVMALVPPEELQVVLAQRPGALSPTDQQMLTDLVTKGFQEWKAFHDRYSTQQREIKGLDPGAATWTDVADFVREHLKGRPALGFSALAFVLKADEVVEASEEACVLAVDGKPYSCGDYGGMPVTSDTGESAERLGTNHPLIAAALRRLAFPDAQMGAAHLRWPEGAERPMSGAFGVIAVARQSVRWEGGSYQEAGIELHLRLVASDGSARDVARSERGAIVRALTRSIVRREPASEAELADGMRRSELELLRSLKAPSESDLARRHALTPLLAAIVT